MTSHDILSSAMKERGTDNLGALARSDYGARGPMVVRDYERAVVRIHARECGCGQRIPGLWLCWGFNLVRPREWAHRWHDLDAYWAEVVPRPTRPNSPYNPSPYAVAALWWYGVPAQVARCAVWFVAPGDGSRGLRRQVRAAMRIARKVAPYWRWGRRAPEWFAALQMVRPRDWRIIARLSPAAIRAVGGALADGQDFATALHRLHRLRPEDRRYLQDQRVPASQWLLPAWRYVCPRNGWAVSRKWTRLWSRVERAGDEYVSACLRAVSDGGPVRGWRAFTVSEEGLRSPYMGTLWPSPVLHAEGWVDGSIVRCVSGIHACWTLEQVIQQDNDLHRRIASSYAALAVVRGWGRIQAGPEGWRAEWCAIERVVASPLAADAIRRQYPGLEVEVQECILP